MINYFFYILLIQSFQFERRKQLTDLQQTFKAKANNKINMSNKFKQYPVGSPRKVFGLRNINTYKVQPIDLKVIQSLKQLDERAGSIQNIQKQRKKRKQYLSMSLLNDVSILNKSQDVLTKQQLRQIAKTQALEMFTSYKKTKQQIIKKQSYLLPKLKTILKDEIIKNDQITIKLKKQKQVITKRESLKKLNRISMMKQEQQNCLQSFKTKCSQHLNSLEFSLNTTLLKTQVQNSYFFSNDQKSFAKEQVSIFDDNLLNQSKDQIPSQNIKFKLLDKQQTTKVVKIESTQQKAECKIPQFLMKVLTVNELYNQNALFLTNSSQLLISPASFISTNKNRKSQVNQIDSLKKLR